MLIDYGWYELSNVEKYTSCNGTIVVGLKYHPIQTYYTAPSVSYSICV